MTRFFLILLFAAAVFGVAVVAMNQPAASPNAPANKTARPGPGQASDSPGNCPTCPMPSN